MSLYGINDTLYADFATIDQKLISILSGKTLVVSGATGFLGSLLARLVIWANDELGLNTRLILCVRDTAKLDIVMPGAIARRDVAITELDFLRPCETVCAEFDYLVHTAAVPLQGSWSISLPTCLKYRSTERYGRLTAYEHMWDQKLSYCPQWKPAAVSMSLQMSSRARWVLSTWARYVPATPRASA